MPSFLIECSAFDINENTFEINYTLSQCSTVLCYTSKDLALNHQIKIIILGF